MKKIFKLSLMLVLVFNLTSCKLSQLQIGVTTYPVSYLVSRIAQDRVSIVDLSQGPTMTRAQIVDNYDQLLDQLDVAFVFGKLEPYLSIYAQDFQDHSVPMVDLTASASVYLFERYQVTDVQGTRVTLESPYYNSPLFDRVDTYQTDPYLWLDPITTISMAGTIKDWLIQHYPEEKAFFEENYATLALELARMDADYQELWKQTIGFVSVTPSFGNWQKAFGVSVYPLILSRYGVLPTEEQLQFILNEVKAAGIQYIVHEPNLSEDMEALYNRVKDELKLKPVEMHSLAFLTEADGAANKNYMTLMWENLDTLEGMTPLVVEEPVSPETTTKP